VATLTQLTNSIENIIQDDSYTDMTDRINDAVSNIAAGIRMPDGQVSPPLNDLYESSVVSTSTDAYINLPANYQRNLFYVTDSAGERIKPVSGGLYDFVLFLNSCYKKDLTETGYITKVCVKGRRLYFQGIPSSPASLTLAYYRRPVRMSEASDEPDGIPDHLQTRLITHYVCKEIFGEGIEDGAEARGIGTKYHTAKFFEAIIDLADFNGIDAEPTYYGCDDGIIGY
jgi:hypothetical protein